tara:strand:+ start:178 stop:378 length:201 start_codon:yes stop_codon:yes gene_type:complete
MADTLTITLTYPSIPFSNSLIGYYGVTRKMGYSTPSVIEKFNLLVNFTAIGIFVLPFGTEGYLLFH